MKKHLIMIMVPLSFFACINAAEEENTGQKSRHRRTCSVAHRSSSQGNNFKNAVSKTSPEVPQRKSSLPKPARLDFSGLPKELLTQKDEK